MNKQFDKWNDLKKDIHTNNSLIKFQQRHIVFMKIGTNVGYEQDGKGDDFLRPILVYKKFNNQLFLGIPLTSRIKDDKFHFEFEYKKGKRSFAILSQMRLFDIKRAKYYDGKISNDYFEKLQDKLLKLIVTPPKKGGECTKAICEDILSEKHNNVKLNKTDKIYIAGHRGLVGSAIVKNLESKGYTNLVYKTHKELDLLDTNVVKAFFEEEKPEFVILAAAKVGGIVANNTYRADFIYENLQIQNNIIHQSYLNGVQKLLFLGSTCIYPKNAPQPMKENSLLTSELEYTNEPYAIAKIAGIKMCESYNLQYGTNFISVMPTNLYGPNDNFDLETSHVLPALLRKMHEAKLSNTPKVEIWGSGRPRREFLYSEDMADACVFIMKNINFKDIVNQNSSKSDEIRNTHINIGTGVDISIKELALTIKKIVGYEGELYFNDTKPDGTMVKLTDPSKLSALGWKHTVELEDGIKRAYEWYLENNN